MLPLHCIILSDEIKVVSDGRHGVENLNVKSGWDGMVGELIRGVK